MNKSAVIISTGSYLPEKILTNHDLAKFIDTSDEWITERSGIKQRHIAADYELTSDLASKALQAALQKINMDPLEIDHLIVATTTPDSIFPSTACNVQAKLGLKNAASFDIQAVCSGFVYGLHLADALIKSGKAKNIALIGAEIMSRILDWEDRNTCVLFGDGAGAVIISAKPEANIGILATEIHSDGNFNEILNTNNENRKIQMQGREVFKHAVEKMSSSLAQIIQKCNFKIKDIDFLVPHQANIRIINQISKKIGLEEHKIIATLSYHANTSAASIPLALADLSAKQQLSSGKILAITALGAGVTWGSAIIKW